MIDKLVRWWASAFPIVRKRIAMRRARSVGRVLTKRGGPLYRWRLRRAQAEMFKDDPSW